MRTHFSSLNWNQPSEQKATKKGHWVVGAAVTQSGSCSLQLGDGRLRA